MNHCTRSLLQSLADRLSRHSPTCAAMLVQLTALALAVRLNLPPALCLLFPLLLGIFAAILTTETQAALLRLRVAKTLDQITAARRIRSRTIKETETHVH